MHIFYPYMYLASYELFNAAPRSDELMHNIYRRLRAVTSYLVMYYIARCDVLALNRRYDIIFKYT